MTDITQTETYQKLLSLNPCPPAMRWIEANKYQSTEWLWDNCSRAEWMMWLIDSTVGRKVGSPKRILLKKLVLCNCDIARSVLHLVPKGENRPRIAIETAEKYCRGKATLEEVNATALGASAAAHVYNVASWAAAYNAASAAAFVVCIVNTSWAANAAKHAGATIDFPAIVRKHYPECPI